MNSPGTHDLPRPAAQRLILQHTQFERSTDKSVLILNNEGIPLVKLDRKDWAAIAEFFDDISQVGRAL